MCVNTYVLNSAFSACECIFLLIFIESVFLFVVFFSPTKYILGVVVSMFSLSSLSPPLSYWLSKATEEKEARERRLVFANDNLLNIYSLQDGGS